MKFKKFSKFPFYSKFHQAQKFQNQIFLFFFKLFCQVSNLKTPTPSSSPPNIPFLFNESWKKKYFFFSFSSIARRNWNSHAHTIESTANIRKKRKSINKETYYIEAFFFLSSIYFLLLAIQIGGSLNTHNRVIVQMSLYVASRLMLVGEKKCARCFCAKKGAALMCIPFVWWNFIYDSLHLRIWNVVCFGFSVSLDGILLSFFFFFRGDIECVTFFPPFFCKIRDGKKLWSMQQLISTFLASDIWTMIVLSLVSLIIAHFHFQFRHNFF